MAYGPEGEVKINPENTKTYLSSQIVKKTVQRTMRENHNGGGGFPTCFICGSVRKFSWRKYYLSWNYKMSRNE